MAYCVLRTWQSEGALPSETILHTNDLIETNPKYFFTKQLLMTREIKRNPQTSLYHWVTGWIVRHILKLGEQEETQVNLYLPVPSSDNPPAAQSPPENVLLK